MPFRMIFFLTVSVAILSWPYSAFGKRAASPRVTPVVWQGIEYRAPLDVDHMGHVQAFEPVSGRKLWDRKVYQVLIVPFAEEDVQWVFISSMHVQDVKLLVKNEAGKSFRLDLKTGRVEGQIQWFAWGLGGLVVLMGFIAWILKAKRTEVPST